MSFGPYRDLSGEVMQPGGPPVQVLSATAAPTASSTDTAVVAAAAGFKVRVLSVVLSGPTATAVTFNSKPAGAGTAISATFICPANGNLVLPYDPHGWFKDTNVGEGLSVTTGSGGTVNIQIGYCLIGG